MIRLWFIFIIISVLLHFGITAWRKMSGKDRWSLTKTAAYSIIIALLTVAVMTTIVILF